jgi:hypothetical protein
VTQAARRWVFPALTCDGVEVSEVLIFQPSEK